MELFNGDCLEIMKGLPDRSIDLFLCDLPYGCLTQQKGVNNNKNSKSPCNAGCSWDIKIDLEEFWKQVKRLCKNDKTPVIMFCNARFGFDLYNSNPAWFRYDLIWSKGRGVGFLNTNNQPLRSHENIYVFSKKGANYYRKDIEGDFKRVGGGSDKKAKLGIYGLIKGDENRNNEGRRCVKSVIEVSNTIAKGQHPTAKPIDLYKFLIERYSKEGDTILDPTFGSGHSGLASIDLNRKYIGIEKDEKFFTKFSSAREEGRERD